MGRHYAKPVLCVLSCFILFACAPPQLKVPVETRLFDLDRNDDTQCLVVLLPGRGDRLDAFERSGFVRVAQEKGFPGDLMATDLHIGYYYDRSTTQRLEEDIIAPAREKGYGEIWLVSISMGAIGSIMHQREYPRSVDGMVFMAPYLGEDAILDAIESSGGVLAWEPGNVEKDDYQRILWSWIQNYARSGASDPPLWLAYAEEDRYARASVLLSTVLPHERVLTTSGGHYWRAWLRLWEQLLDRGVLCGGR